MDLIKQVALRARQWKAVNSCFSFSKTVIKTPFHLDYFILTCASPYLHNCMVPGVYMYRPSVLLLYTKSVGTHLFTLTSILIYTTCCSSHVPHIKSSISCVV